MEHVTQHVCHANWHFLLYRFPAVQEWQDASRRIEVIDLAENGQEDLIQDFVSIVTSFYARLYGQRRPRRKTERLITELSHSPAASVSSPGGHA